MVKFMSFVTEKKLENPKKIKKKNFSQNWSENSYKTYFVYNGSSLIPGIVRLRDAPYYLGMNKTFFRDTVQPYLTRIPIDKKGIGFSREELDRWIAYAQATIGQPPKKQPPWEKFHMPASKPEEIAVENKKSLKKIRINKSSLRGKPTSQDLDNLINKTLGADS